MSAALRLVRPLPCGAPRSCRRCAAPFRVPLDSSQHWCSACVQARRDGLVLLVVALCGFIVSCWLLWALAGWIVGATG